MSITIQHKISAIFRLTRPVNVLITILSVWIAALLSAELNGLNYAVVFIGALAAGVIAAGGNIHNDILDIEIDRVNRPERPLPQKELSLRTAGIFSIIFVAAGIGTGAALGIQEFLITLTAAVLLFLYNQRLKMTVLWGNLTISLLTGLAFIFGGVLAGNPLGGIIPAVFSLFFHFSREIVKDVEDFPGDSVRSGETFVMKYGINAARKTAVVSLLILFIIVPLPYFAKFYKIGYLLCSIITVEAPLLWVVVNLCIFDKTKIRRLSQILKFGMVMGLVSLFLGR